VTLTLAQLAAGIGAELSGDGNLPVSGVAPLERAVPGEVSFLANPRYRRFLPATRASAVIVAPVDAAAVSVARLVMDNPYAGYARAVRMLYPAEAPRRGLHPAAVISAGAQVHPHSWIDAFCSIGEGAEIGSGTELGPGCIIGPGVSIGPDCRLLARVTVLASASIGARSILHPGVVIGADGFGLAYHDGQWEKIPQVGSVVIGDDVEIGANTTIDRGALADTVIEAGVKIDNLVQVAHNVFIGAHTAIAACAGISGSTRIGRHCTLAGGVGVFGHLEIVDHVHITGMSMVTHSITRPGTYSAGTPIMENRQWRRNAVRFKQLDALSRRVRKIEDK
jgi:UDP-3-O-[3-hydroxymyristoyl] glucosamine N-acyltransferase